MKPTMQFQRVLEQQYSLKPMLLADAVRLGRDEYIQRGWITSNGYLTHVKVPFFEDIDAEVKVEIDEAAGQYVYNSLVCRGRVVRRALEDITMYAINLNAWLDHLAAVLDIEPRRVATKREQIDGHLWHLGDVRIRGTHEFAPVFWGRRLRNCDEPQLMATLGDARWARPGVVFEFAATPGQTRGDHEVRTLADFIDVDEQFDLMMLDRVLSKSHLRGSESEPIQFIRGNRVKLPHFTQSRDEPAMRAKIIKACWGMDQAMSPVISWAEANARASTSYQSFADAFKAALPEYFDKIGRGRYRLRRQAFNSEVVTAFS